MLEAVGRLLRIQPAAKTEALVRQVVEASLQDVARLVARRVEDMTLSEARGFVRARSAAVVRRQARIVLSRLPQARAEWHASIVHLATERIIPQVLRQTGVGVPRRVTAPLAA
jgi:hypothetical protein